MSMSTSDALAGKMCGNWFVLRDGLWMDGIFRPEKRGDFFFEKKTWVILMKWWRLMLRGLNAWELYNDEWLLFFLNVGEIWSVSFYTRYNLSGHVKDTWNVICSTCRMLDKCKKRGMTGREVYIVEVWERIMIRLCAISRQFWDMPFGSTSSYAIYKHILHTRCMCILIHVYIAAI